MDPTTDPSVLLDALNWGVLGLVVIGFWKGWIVPKHTYDREMNRVDRLEKENAELRDRTEKEVIPLLTRAVDIVRAVTERDRRE